MHSWEITFLYLATSWWKMLQTVWRSDKYIGKLSSAVHVHRTRLWSKYVYRRVSTERFMHVISQLQDYCSFYNKWKKISRKGPATSCIVTIYADGLNTIDWRQIKSAESVSRVFIAESQVGMYYLVWFRIPKAKDEKRNFTMIRCKIRISKARSPRLIVFHTTVLKTVA